MTSIIRGSDDFDSANAAPATWQDVSGSRSVATPYVNGTKDIEVSVRWTTGGNITGYGVAQLTVDGEVVYYQNRYFGTTTESLDIPPTKVPAGATYQVDVSGTFGGTRTWKECR